MSDKLAKSPPPPVSANSAKPTLGKKNSIIVAKPKTTEPKSDGKSWLDEMKEKSSTKKYETTNVYETGDVESYVLPQCNGETDSILVALTGYVEENLTDINEESAQHLCHVVLSSTSEKVTNTALNCLIGAGALKPTGGHLLVSNKPFKTSGNKSYRSNNVSWIYGYFNGSAPMQSQLVNFPCIVVDAPGRNNNPDYEQLVHYVLVYMRRSDMNLVEQITDVQQWNNDTKPKEGTSEWVSVLCSMGTKSYGGKGTAMPKYPLGALTKGFKRLSKNELDKEIEEYKRSQSSGFQKDDSNLDTYNFRPSHSMYHRSACNPRTGDWSMRQLKKRSAGKTEGLLCDGVFRFEISECKDTFGSIVRCIKPMFMFCVDRRRVSKNVSDNAF